MCVCGGVWVWVWVCGCGWGGVGGWVWVGAHACMHACLLTLLSACMLCLCTCANIFTTYSTPILVHFPCNHSKHTDTLIPTLTSSSILLTTAVMYSGCFEIWCTTIGHLCVCAYVHACMWLPSNCNTAVISPMHAISDNFFVFLVQNWAPQGCEVLNECLPVPKGDRKLCTWPH